jgi:hypothetical protein
MFSASQGLLKLVFLMAALPEIGLNSSRLPTSGLLQQPSLVSSVSSRLHDYAIVVARVVILKWRTLTVLCVCGCSTNQ